MPQIPLEPAVADIAPTDASLTSYDKDHLIIYVRLLDAEADHAAWEEVARLVLHIDPKTEPDRARKAWATHLARAHWMSEHGYRDLLED